MCSIDVKRYKGGYKNILKNQYHTYDSLLDERRAG